MNECLTKHANSIVQRAKEDPNVFSNWWSIIKELKSDYIHLPSTTIVETPVQVIAALLSDNYTDEEVLTTIEKHVKEKINPCVEPRHRVFAKNGTFSNKFNFQHCITNRLSMLSSFIEINYGSMMCGAGGLTEFVLREVINSTPRTIGTIYNGMPLNCEFRCFYHPAYKKVLYTANYWDKATVEESLYSYNDQLIFDIYYPSIESDFNAQVTSVEKFLEEFLEPAVFPNYDGVYPSDSIWSVDIMMDETGKLWLIDMALACDSAYWDSTKAGQAIHRIMCGY